MGNNNKKSKKKIIIISLIALLVVSVVVVALTGKKGNVITVQTEKVKRRTITQTVTATGKIYPEIQVVITPEVSGEIIELPVREGIKVKKGDLLLKIKPDIYIAMRDRSAAGLVAAKASLQRSESDYNRSTELFKKGLISDAELEQTVTSYEMAKAQYNQALAALNQSTEDLRKTSIYAPMDGTVSQLRVELGERVLGTSQFQGTTVMTIADLSRMEARVDVVENDIVLISINDTARIEVDALPDKKLTGIVYEIANTAKSKGIGTQEEVTNFEVKIRILDKDVPLRPGMSMTATIETETKENVLAVPLQSLTIRSPSKREKNEESGQDEIVNDTRIKTKNEKTNEVVFIVEGNVAKKVEVRRGIADDSYIEIISGLQENQEVVSGSYKAISRELEDNSKVRVDNTKSKKKDTSTK